jgi:hypothetical protein
VHRLAVALPLVAPVPHELKSHKKLVEKKFIIMVGPTLSVALLGLKS